MLDRLRSDSLRFLTFTFLLAAGGCAHVHENMTQNNQQVQAAENHNTDMDHGIVYDPWESVNRDIYKFNYAFDWAILHPITRVYRYAVPEFGRSMVSNFMINLYSPVVFADSVLAGDAQNSFATLWRFMLNSTFGVAGLFDFAGNEAGLHNRHMDFGQVLAVYGVEAGPYVEIPIIGPSDVRDAAGRLVDAFIDPFNYISNAASIGIWSATAIDQRSINTKLIDGVYDSSIDPYATFRSLYTQKRAADIKHTKKDISSEYHQDTQP